ncbi:hypothetical protein [Microvirga lenta]|uniref:hypothetical protein n=1 Tax=Microvirga lenta TaxID=2881337 RepID=UPI001CFDD3A7|nr:hypothetical protein [Microvirga lenta]MCB5173582.1 hypothetical protein [Microvirga lenta]
MTTLPSTSPWGDELPVGVRFKAATGTSDVALQEVLIRQIIDALPASQKRHPADQASLADAALAALTELQPKDSSDGLLGAGIVTAHFAAMDCLKQAMDVGQLPHVRDMNLRHAERLLRNYLQLQEAYDRRRGRGLAHVTAGNFLTVQPGGQAVVRMDAQVGQATTDVDAPAPLHEHHRDEIGAIDGSAGVVKDERIRGSAVSVSQDERIRRSPGPSDERIVRRG